MFNFVFTKTTKYYPQMIKNLLIIGNGFDLSLGMKTSYKAFYEYLCKKRFFDSNQSNVLINYVRNVNNNYYWYDFEGILKEFAKTSEFALRVKQCHKAIDIINEFVLGNDIDTVQLSKQGLLEAICPNYCKLLDILKEQCLTKDTLTACKLTLSCLKQYCNKIKEDVQEGLKKLKEEMLLFLTPAKPTIENKHFPAEWIICAMYGVYERGRKDNAVKLENDEINNKQPVADIVSFNYTDTLFHITRIIERCGYAISDEEKSLKSHIYNIHGDLTGGDIIFGTDDDLFICQEFNILRKSLAVKDNAKDKFSALLKSSNRIIIFGHSLFAIDYTYYKDFFESSQSKEKEIYIICLRNDIEKFKEEFIRYGIPLANKFFVIPEFNNEFLNLCERIAEDQKAD